MKAIDIAKAVAEFYCIDLESFLKDRSFKKEIKNRRNITRALIRQLTDLTLKETAAVFGNTDHTTVINSVEFINNLPQKDPLKADYNKILMELNIKEYNKQLREKNATRYRIKDKLNRVKWDDIKARRLQKFEQVIDRLLTNKAA